MDTMDATDSPLDATDSNRSSAGNAERIANPYPYAKLEMSYTSHQALKPHVTQAAVVDHLAVVVEHHFQELRSHGIRVGVFVLDRRVDVPPAD